MERLTLEDAISHAKEVAEKNYKGIRKIEISDNSIIFKTNRQKRIFNVAEFGKTVFLAREDAEKKLEEF